MDSRELYLAHREPIERAINAVCRRQRLSADDAEEFASDARLHFLKDDGAVLQSFGGRSSLSTFLVAVLIHLFQDWRNAKWGKWRPSAEAVRQGPLAVRLETLTVRDRLSFDEAYETLRTNESATASRAQLESMAARFPRRHRPSFITDDALVDRPADHASPDRALLRSEATAAAAFARETLALAMAALPAQDRLIIRLRYADGHRVQQIAQLLHLDAKPLYRRIERILADLRVAVERQGLSASDALEAMGDHGFQAPADSEPGREAGADVRLFEKPQRSPAAGRWP